MRNQTFSTPVFLVLSGLGNFCADTPWESFEYLDLHWPAARTAEYRRTKTLCRVAIDGVVPAEQARRALVRLAQRHGLLADGPGGIDPSRKVATPARATPHPPAADAVS